MINFEKQKWYNKNDTENKDKRIPVSANHLNRIEDAISATVDHANDMAKHWWKTSRITGKEIYIPTTNSSNHQFSLQSKVDTITFYYSETVKTMIDKQTGKVYAELENPSTWEISYNLHGDGYNSIMSGKYFILGRANTRDDGVLYYLKSGGYSYASNKYVGSVNTYYLGFESKYLYEPAFKDTYEEVGYVSSPNNDEYGDGLSEDDGLIYEYLGVPFENSRESGGMITGWYYGDGTQNRLIKTAHKPKMVMSNGSIYAVDYGSGNSLLTDDGFFGMNAAATKYSYVVFY